MCSGEVGASYSTAPQVEHAVVAVDVLLHLNPSLVQSDHVPLNIRARRSAPSSSGLLGREFFVFVLYLVELFNV